MDFQQRPPAVSMSPGVAGKPPTELRQFARAQVDLAATYSLSGRDGRRAARIDNLGGGGLRLETDEDLSAGTTIGLSFKLGEVTIAASGRVAMSLFDGGRSRFLHGVAFAAIDPAHQAAIASLIADLTTT